MRYLIGIDAAKAKNDIAIFNSDMGLVRKPFTVSQSQSDIQKLAKSFAAIDGDVRAVVESTGRYHLPIVEQLSKERIFVSVVNPKLIKQFGDNSLRNVKNDPADAKKICRYGILNWDSLREYTNMDELRTQLQLYNSQFEFFTSQKVSVKSNLIALLDMTYPGVNQLFNSPVRPDGSEKWVDYAELFWHVDCVRSLSLHAFSEKYRHFCEKQGYHFQQGKCESLYASAQDLIAVFPKNAQYKALVKMAIGNLKEVITHVETLRAAMNEIASQLPEYPVVMAMKGVGPSLGPQLMAEIGDPMRFKHREALTAFAGVDPGVNQSGTLNQGSNCASKTGNPRLRHTLFKIMEVLIKLHPEEDKVYQFMDKKRSEGKPYLVYMTVGANKFLRIYYGKTREYLHALEADKETNE